MSTTGFAGLRRHRDSIASGPVFKNVIEWQSQVNSSKKSQKTKENENFEISLIIQPEEIDIGKYKTEKHVGDSKSNQQPTRESGDHRSGEGVPPPEVNGKSTGASKLNNNGSNQMRHQGHKRLAEDGPWHSVLLSSDHENEKRTYTTKTNTKDSEAGQQTVDGWYDVNHEDAYARIEHDYVDLGNEEGSELSDDWMSMDIGSRDSRPNKVRRGSRPGRRGN